ncbi:hypothetical protein CAGGBEG34_260037 [Candidatus Glomeribacter gigasporarum BEG34]|uniref:Uncharacterized protein n=1 Tax=Candidatus Glomeribacter gigasporarum BEG34 TaxID=1070319 RepID=G2J9Z1_9BURK|nr:hypothetical protein [Candidatus Glomeribacter gigasporarum]CCD29588.1 hypothetical protein CAGGBEG34_260037 [Candidatus Glomeribacter gigasporarum BEG34]
MWNSSSYGGVDLSLYNAVSEEELKQQNFLKSADIKELKEACKQNSDLKIDIFKSAAICEKFTPNQLVELVTVEGFMPGSDDKSTKAAKLLLQNPHFLQQTLAPQMPESESNPAANLLTLASIDPAIEKQIIQDARLIGKLGADHLNRIMISSAENARIVFDNHGLSDEIAERLQPETLFRLALNKENIEIAQRILEHPILCKILIENKNETAQKECYIRLVKAHHLYEYNKLIPECLMQFNSEIVRVAQSDGRSTEIRDALLAFQSEQQNNQHPELLDIVTECAWALEIQTNQDVRDKFNAFISCCRSHGEEDIVNILDEIKAAQQIFLSREGVLLAIQEKRQSSQIQKASIV